MLHILKTDHSLSKILGCIQWYCKYGINYRELEEMMLEREFEVDHTTLYHWVQHFTPEIEKHLQ